MEPVRISDETSARMDVRWQLLNEDLDAVRALLQLYQESVEAAEQELSSVSESDRFSSRDAAVWLALKQLNMRTSLICSQVDYLLQRRMSL